MKQFPQQFVDKIGMYRVVTLSLLGLLIWSLVAGGIGWLAYGPSAQLVALSGALCIGILLNIIFAKIWNITANHESALITILILFFLVIPSDDLTQNIQLYSATALAIASKFLIVYRKQHIINPVVAGTTLLVVIISLYNFVTKSSINVDIFTWWVSSPIFIAPVLLFGGLIILKIRKWTPVLWFLLIGAGVFLLESIRLQQPLLESLILFCNSYPTIFLAAFMLTEPFTMPPTKKSQAWYGGLVGALSNSAIFAPWFAMTPELALLFGNLFAYCFRIRQKLQLKLISKQEIAHNIWEFTFEKPSHFTFTAGQYLEWMLPHKKPDNRGLRRYFTLASSPTESVVRLAFSVDPKEGSSYKKAILDLKKGDIIIASQLAGDFVLPKNKENTLQKFGFIAGGIGVTPFSSHLQYMADTNYKAQTRLYYCASKKDQLAYLEDFKNLSTDVEVTSVLSKEKGLTDCECERLSEDIIVRITPDYLERTWYLSGPPAMVDAATNILKSLKVPSKNIHQDFFPGLA